MTEPPTALVGVIGASGGLGSSTLAALAAAAGARHCGGRAVLVDLDPASGGADVLVGVESAPGARWSGVRFAGGRLDPDSLRDGLPVWSSVLVLAADQPVAPVATVEAVLDAALQIGPVVLDLARSCPVSRQVAARCDLVVAVTRPDVAGLTAARTCVLGLTADAPTRVGLVVRGGSRSGADALGPLVGAPVLGWLPAVRPLDHADALPVSAPPRAVRQVARALIRAAIDGCHAVAA